MARIAFMIDDEFEDSEFIYPYHRLKEAGHQVDIIARKAGNYFGKTDTQAHAEYAISDVLVSHYDALYIPGGYAPERLCQLQEAVLFVKTFVEHDMLVCAVCHAPLLLANAGVLHERIVTGYGSIKEEVLKAGAVFTGESVEVDGNLITARDPRSLPEMTQTLLKALEKTGS